MVDLSLEQERTIGTSDALAIIDMATQMAEMNGVVFSALYERAVYMLLAKIIYPDDETLSSLAEDLGGTWDQFVEDGTLEKMNVDHANDVNFVNNLASAWYEEYTEFAMSARGVLDFVQSLAGDTMAKARDQLANAMQDSETVKILNLANDWGMNNGIDNGTNKDKNGSLFVV